MSHIVFKILFSILLNSIMCIFAINFLNKTCGGYFVSKKIFYFVAIIGVLFVTLINTSNMSSYNINLAGGASIIVVLAFLYKIKIWVKLLFSFIFIVLSIISQMFSVIIVSKAINNNLNELTSNFFAFATITIISVVFIWCLCYVILKLKKYSENKVPNKISMFLLTVPVSSLIILIIIFSWYISNEEEIKLALLMVIGVLYINFIVFYMFDQISGRLKERGEKEVLEKQIKMQLKYYQNLEKYQNEVRAIKHDMKNKLLMVNQIINEYGTEQAQGFISTMIDTVSNVSKIIDTGNPYIDAILNIKLDEATKNNIDVTIDIIIPSGLKISFEKASVLFGNLLDNCIESCIISDDKRIFIKMNIVNNALYLNIYNPSKDVSVITKKQDKLNHGIGLKNVEHIIKEFNGIMKIEHINGFFNVKIVLYGLLE